MYTVIVFCSRKKDWIPLGSFNQKAAAELYIENYPRFGAGYSRTIREGNWQITKY